MNVQVIEKDGKPEWAVIPYEEYERLAEEAEMLQDIRAYDEAKEATKAGEELVPSEVTYAILDGENPIRVWREHRGLTQRRLAEAAGMTYQVKLDEAKACLPDLIEATIRGENVFILKDDHPVVQLVPVKSPRRHARFGGHG